MADEVDLPKIARRRIELARLAVCGRLPYLAGLAWFVRLVPADVVEVAGITRDGRLIYNPRVFAAMTVDEAAFVFAHELMHLALRHHERAEQCADPGLANLAQDYVINDLLADLANELPRGDRGLPRIGGVYRPGAAREGAEAILVELIERRRQGEKLPNESWSSREATDRTASLPGTGTALEAAFHKALGRDRTGADSVTPPAADACSGMDLILAHDSPRACAGRDDDPQRQRALSRLVEEACSLATLGEAMRCTSALPGLARGNQRMLVDALRAHRTPPWELALQRWMDDETRTQRCYHRSSRRPGADPEVAMPGRKREGWMLHIVIDVSGSMEFDLPRVLGMIARFAEERHVGKLRVLTCDVAVTHDEYIEPEALARFPIEGFGGSDMSPAMLRLAEDPEVEAVIVLTDGFIDFPPGPMPYEVLWVVLDDYSYEHPPFPYGSVLWVDPV